MSAAVTAGNAPTNVNCARIEIPSVANEDLMSEKQFFRPFRLRHLQGPFLHSAVMTLPKPKYETISHLTDGAELKSESVSDLTDAYAIFL